MINPGQYPECDKLSECHSEKIAILNFLQWCDEQEYELRIWTDENQHNPQPLRKNREELMADYFEYDLKKVEAALQNPQSAQSDLDRILKRVDNYRKDRGAPPLKCVVVESDWPEYEPVWAMIEARMAREAQSGNT